MRAAATIGDAPFAVGPVERQAAINGGGTLENRARADIGEGQPGEDRPLDIRMIVSDDVVLESRDDTHVVVANVAQATRVRLSRGAYRFLQAFRQPRRVSEVISPDDARRAVPQIRMLIAKHLLVDADAPVTARQAKLRSAVAYKFCNAPAYVAAQAPEFVVLGIPYDLSAETDSRLAPGLIRQKSLDYPYQLRFDDARPRGWFDADRATRILEGATIADVGDVHVDYGESWLRFRKRVGLVLAQACGGGSIPVILGGDRRATYAVVEGMPSGRDLVVVQITADPARVTAEGAGQHLLSIEHVRRVVSVDGCGGDAADLRAFGILPIGPGDDPCGTTDAADSDLEVYLSIDLDILAPAAQNRATPAPTLQDLKTLIGAIGAARPIIGIDLVGLDMRCGAPVLNAIAGCQLALTAMNAAHDRKSP